MIIQHSTGGTGAPDAERHRPLRTDPPPEMASLDMGPLDTLGFGRHQLPFATMGILFGGHVRIGLADNVSYRRGELAESNAQLVELIGRIATELGRPVATPDEAREALRL